MCVSQLVGILNESFFNDCPLLEAVRCSQSTKQKKAQQMICAYLLFDPMLLEMVCALLKDVQITNPTNFLTLALVLIYIIFVDT